MFMESKEPFSASASTTIKTKADMKVANLTDWKFQDDHGPDCKIINKVGSAIEWLVTRVEPKDYSRITQALCGLNGPSYTTWRALFGVSSVDANKEFHTPNPDHDIDAIFDWAESYGWTEALSHAVPEASPSIAVQEWSAGKVKALTAAMRYQRQSADDLMTAPPLRWLVHGVLPEKGLAALYGPPGSGKSFLALDLCAAVSGGQDWFSRRTAHVAVTYVALEGAGGLGKRVRAWRETNHAPMPDVGFITQAFDLRQKQDVADLCAAVLAAGGAGGLVVIDTLNRAAPGADENSAADMGAIVEACATLQRQIDGVVLVIHHTGKEVAKGLRGHSSLIGALDAAVEVTRNGDRREWSVAKSRDEADGECNTFELRRVEMGFDEFGAAITSCVVIAEEGVAAVKQVRTPQGGNQKIAYDALAPHLAESKLFGKGDAPADRPCLNLEFALVTIAKHMLCEPKRKRERAQTALTGLINNGFYGHKEEWLWRK